jgi:hypothetical protein
LITPSAFIRSIGKVSASMLVIGRALATSPIGDAQAVDAVEQFRHMWLCGPLGRAFARLLNK